MTLPQLENLVRIRQLKAEPPSRAEFEGLVRALNVSSEHWRVLDQAHRKRNLAEYEGEIDIDSALLEALLGATEKLEVAVAALPPITGGGT